jgi:tetratricopeptide (TPR) repeat protein
MTSKIFISMVSSEFHSKDPDKPLAFESYRDVLSRSLRRQIPGCEVIVQEELKQSFGDLLHTLDREVEGCDVVIHVIGELAGAKPELAELRRLTERHPQFLDHEPELRHMLQSWEDISYTQWEVYLAYEHRKHQLVFIADPSAPRSPLRGLSADKPTNQQAHLFRMEKTGKHRSPCLCQSDLAVKSIVAIERYGLNPTQTSPPPAPDRIAHAKAHATEIISDFVASLRRSAKIAIQEYDPAGIEAYLKALDPIVQQYGLTRRSLLDILAEEQQSLRRSLEKEQTSKNLNELALAEFAVGSYHDAVVAIRLLIENEIIAMTADSENYSIHRDMVLTCHLMWHDAADFAGLKSDAYLALQQGARFLDREEEPSLWAEFHEQIAEYCLEHGNLREATELINHVIDVREEHESDSSAVLAKSLLLWARVLYSNANYPGVIDVARRAERIYSAHFPGNSQKILLAWTLEAGACILFERFSQAEELTRKALEKAQSFYGPDHPAIAPFLSNLATILRDTLRLDEADALFRRAVLMGEHEFGPNHRNVAKYLNNLATVLQRKNLYAEAEILYRRALEIDENACGASHPDVARDLDFLSGLLLDLSQFDTAEPLVRRGLAIAETSFEPNHPAIAEKLNSLALVLYYTNRFTEAEPLLRRALEISEAKFGLQHTSVARAMNNLARVLAAMNQFEEAEKLYLKALDIDRRILPPNHPDIARDQNLLAALYLQSNRLSEAESMIRKALSIHESCYGRFHFDVGSDLNILGGILINSRRLDDAVSILERSLQIHCHIFGVDHPHTQIVEQNFRQILVSIGYTHEQAVSRCEQITLLTVPKL